MEPSLRWLIVADDVTGAADTAVLFALAGHKTIVSLSADWERADAEVLAMDAAGRSLRADDARRVMVHFFSTLRSDHKFLKIDSTLRGPIGAMVDGALSATGSRWGIVCPAVPSQGRIVRDGQLFVHGQPLAVSPFALLGSPPIRSSAVADRLLSTGLSGWQLRHLAITSARSVAQIRSFLLDAAQVGCLVLADAEDQETLNRIAETALTIDPKPLWIGASGLAQAIARPPFVTGLIGPLPPLCRVLIVSGSTHPVTEEQLHCLKEAGIPIIEPASLGGDKEEWTSLPALAVRTAASGPSLKDSEESLRDLVLKWTVGGRSGIVVIGGDTARRIFTVIGVKKWRLIGALAPGVPVGIADRGLETLVVATKAGGFGESKTLINVVALLLGKSFG
ncbi:MAG: hypothetical protein NZ959_04820 [Armatimonadetes bacterium]|nr:hypothetical protein [Armatimonadota bacterium]MDW8120896.1 four-carbon acid sugar kinase family protein [Armatimonadota bacterium]